MCHRPLVQMALNKLPAAATILLRPSPPILPSKQMFSSALELSGLTKCDAVQASKVLDGAAPHWEIAVVAETTLALEGGRSGFDEGFRLSRHGGLLIN